MESSACRLLTCATCDRRGSASWDGTVSPGLLEGGSARTSRYVAQRTYPASVDIRAEVREFLVSRRARLSPEQAGVESYGTRRRVAGLRREEVARLAGVSVDYYTRLERGNLSGVSESVLDAIARALCLDGAERDHLYDLARQTNTPRARAPRRTGAVPLRPALQHLLDAITDAPAYISDSGMDIVAANQLGYALHSPMFSDGNRSANHSRFIFLDPRSRDFYVDWDQIADANVGILRRLAGRNPYDRRITDLVGELAVHSDEFGTRWTAHNVHHHYTGVKSFNHPVVGRLDLGFQAVELEGDPGLSLNIYPAEPGSAAHGALHLLASWTASNEAPGSPVQRSSPGRS